MWENYLSIIGLLSRRLSFKSFVELRAFQNLEGSLKDLEGFVFEKSLKGWFQDNPNWVSNVHKTYEEIQRENLILVNPYHEDYPMELLRLNQPPVALTIKGKLIHKNKLSVVGSREPTLPTLEWMDRYLTPIVKSGTVLVSGAARGVDQKAHGICMRYGMPTVAFLPSGLSSVYPRDFQNYVDTIVGDGGAVVSEYCPKDEMRKQNFLERNRLIAAMSPVVFVAESRRRSGSLITARHAIELGKEVCTLPQHPTQIKGWGSLDLLYDGAHLIRDESDLIELMGGTL